MAVESLATLLLVENCFATWQQRQQKFTHRGDETTIMRRQ